MKLQQLRGLAYALVLFEILCCWSIGGRNIVEEDFVEEDHVFNLSVVLKRPTGEDVPSAFSFNLFDLELEGTVQAFCTANLVENGFCSELYDEAVRRRYEYAELRMLIKEFAKNTEVINSEFIPNKHLERLSVAMTAEIDNHYKSVEYTRNMSFAVNQTFERMQRIIHPTILQELPGRQRHQTQVVIIHSCSLSGENNRVLSSLLSKLLSAGLIARKIHVFVLNYGVDINNNLIKQYERFPRIYFLQVSREISYFEVPTMLLLHRLSRLFSSTHRIPAQFLYLHTKGVSYKVSYPQIEDWRDFMLYFLVELHNSCYHLLASGEIDTIGANFKTRDRDFRGNFWWATAAYLSSLEPLSLHLHGKYAAETWMLTGHTVRVYNWHESAVDHHHTPYPRSKYALSEPELRAREDILHDERQQQRRPPLSFDQFRMPVEKHRTFYCRAKRMSWASTNEELLAHLPARYVNTNTTRSHE